MDDLISLTEKINKATSNLPIFFITNDAERGIGLEKLLTNYHIVAIDDNEIISYMINQGVNVFCLEHETGKQNLIYRNSNRLLQHEKTQSYINKYARRGYLMFFKIAPNLFNTAEKMGFEVLDTSA